MTEIDKQKNEFGIQDLPHELRICIRKVMTSDDFNQSILLQAAYKTDAQTPKVVKDLVTSGMLLLDATSPESKAVVEKGVRQYFGHLTTSIDLDALFRNLKNEEQVGQFVERLKIG